MTSVAPKTASRLGADLIIGCTSRPAMGTDFTSCRKRLLVGTIAAMGEGLNLQGEKTVVFLDQEWSQTKMQQAVDRVHRVDIKEPKNIIYLVGSPVDKLVLQALDRKWSDTKLVTEALTGKEV